MTCLPGDHSSLRDLEAPLSGVQGGAESHVPHALRRGAVPDLLHAQLHASGDRHLLEDLHPAANPHASGPFQVSFLWLKPSPLTLGGTSLLSGQIYPAADTGSLVLCDPQATHRIVHVVAPSLPPCTCVRGCTAQMRPNGGVTSCPPPPSMAVIHTAWLCTFVFNAV